MEFFNRVLSANGGPKERSREAQQINEAFNSSLKDDLKEILDSEDSIRVSNLLDMVYNSSFPEEQIFMKTPARDRLKSKKDLVVRLLMGLDALGVPSMAYMLVYIKKYGMEGIEDILMTLLELISPHLEGKQIPEYTADDVLDAMDSEWHSTPGIGSPLLNVIASATSSPRASAASIGDSPFLSTILASSFRRVFSDRSLRQSQAHELGAKAALDKTPLKKSSAPQILETSVSARYPSSIQDDKLSTMSIPSITSPSFDETVSSSSGQDASPKQGLQLKHRKSSSLRQLFADENIQELIESSARAPSERVSRSSSLQQTSSDVTEIVLDRSAPSFSYITRGADPVAQENKNLLNDAVEHMQSNHSNWREVLTNSNVDLSNDHNINQTSVNSIDNENVSIDDMLKTMVHNGHSSVEDTSANGSAQVPDRTDVMESTCNEVTVDGAMPFTADHTLSSPRYDANFKSERDMHSMSIANVDNNGKYQMQDAAGAGELNTNELDSRLLQAPTSPTQESVETCDAHNAQDLGSNESKETKDFTFSGKPGSDEGNLLLQESINNTSAEGITSASAYNSVGPHHQLGNVQNSAIYGSELTIDQASCHLKDEEHFPENPYGSDVPLPPPESIVEQFSANITGPVIHESVFPRESEKKNADADSDDNTTSYEGIPVPLQGSIENAAACNKDDVAIDGISITPERNGAAHSIVDPATVKSALSPQMNSQNSSNNVCKSIDKPDGNTNEFPLDEPLQTEYQLNSQHKMHKRSLSDVTLSSFKEENVNDEELIRSTSQIDDGSRSKTLRRRFAEQLGLVDDKMDGLLPERRGVPPDRAMEIVLLKTMQISDSSVQKAGDSEGEQAMSPSDFSSGSMTASSFSSTGSLERSRLQVPEQDIKAEIRNDENDHSLSLHQIVNSDGKKESACSQDVCAYGLLLDAPLQDVKEMDKPYSQSSVGFEGTLASSLHSSLSSEVDVLVEYVDETGRDTASNPHIQNIGDTPGDALWFKFGKDEGTGSKDGYGSGGSARPLWDKNDTIVMDETKTSPMQVLDQNYNHTVSHFQTAVAAPAEPDEVDVLSSLSSSNACIISSPHEEGSVDKSQIVDHKVCDPANASFDSSSPSDGETVNRADSVEAMCQNEKVDAHLSTQVLPTLDKLENIDLVQEECNANDLKQACTLPVHFTSQESERGLNEVNGSGDQMHEPLLLAEHDDEPEDYSLGSEHGSSEKVTPPALPVSTENGDENLQNGQFTVGVAEHIASADEHKHKHQDKPASSYALYDGLNDESLHAKNGLESSRTLHEVNGANFDKADLGNNILSSSFDNCESTMEATGGTGCERVDMKSDDASFDSTSPSNGEAITRAGSVEAMCQNEKVDAYLRTQVLPTQDKLETNIDLVKEECNANDLKQATALPVHFASQESERGNNKVDGSRAQMHEPLLLVEQDDEPENYSLGSEHDTSGKVTALALPLSTEDVDENVQNGLFTVGGPEHITAAEHEQQDKPASSFALDDGLQYEASDGTNGLESSRTLYEMNDANFDKHALGNNVVASFEDHESTIEPADGTACERVDMKPDDADPAVKSPSGVEALCQNETGSIPCWEVSDVMDQNERHLLQVDKFSESQPNTMGYAVQMPEGMNVTSQANASDESKDALHQSIDDKDLLPSARTPDIADGPYQGPEVPDINTVSSSEHALNQPAVSVDIPEIMKAVQPKRRRRSYGVPKLSPRWLSCYRQSPVLA